MPRPTRELKTSGGHVLVLYDYITGAENWQIRQIYIHGLKTGDADSSTALEAEKKAFELVILSLDGTSENIADRILALPLTEYKQITDEVAPIVEGKKKLETS